MRWLFMFFPLMLLTACSQGPIAAQDTGVKTGKIVHGKQQELTAFEDIPADSGTKLDPESSIIISEGDNWLGRLTLNNDMSPFHTFEYYRKHMPQLGWNLVASVKSERSVLTYIKGNRVAIVQISGSQFGNSKTTITVSPSTGVSLKQP
ncbi:hypothetical protein [Celerinatantimonas yamalensis]|uniref:Lipoprotein n=1 Tax=Celerinatantimonas yamalensis TaxID=559956 RepID=A0ABW9G3J1_9GAMM